MSELRVEGRSPPRHSCSRDCYSLTVSWPHQPFLWLSFPRLGTIAESNARTRKLAAPKRPRLSPSLTKHLTKEEATSAIDSGRNGTRRSSWPSPMVFQGASRSTTSLGRPYGSSFRLSSLAPALRRTYPFYTPRPSIQSRTYSHSSGDGRDSKG